jgi:predicted PP-loop superfamily ATPase
MMAREIQMCPADQIEIEGINYTGKAKLAIEDGEATLLCCWFALCENEATNVRTHPILGDVPICGRCDAKVEALA